VRRCEWSMNDSSSSFCNDHGTWHNNIVTTNTTGDANDNGTCICSTYYEGQYCTQITLAPFAAAHWVLVGLWIPLLVIAIWYTCTILYGITIGKQLTLYNQLAVLICCILCAAAGLANEFVFIDRDTKTYPTTVESDVQFSFHLLCLRIFCSIFILIVGRTRDVDDHKCRDYYQTLALLGIANG
jgi:hypothetical protein